VPWEIPRIEELAKMGPEKARERKALKRRAIRTLTEELAGVLDAFGWYGIGGAEVALADRSQPSSPAKTAEYVAPSGAAKPEGAEASEGEYDEDEEGDEDHGPTDFETWDIQTAVDGAISSLMGEDLIPELKGLKSAPSLAEIFQVLFGEEHEMTKKVEYFEELIAGYEDRITREDLEEAHSVLDGIIGRLEGKGG
jgi:hypothetical protein